MENGANDFPVVIKMLNVTGITHFGNTYATHEESTTQWMALSKQTLTGIYRHYWLDFVLLGSFSSVDDALRTISYGT